VLCGTRGLSPQLRCPVVLLVFRYGVMLALCVLRGAKLRIQSAQFVRSGTIGRWRCGFGSKRGADSNDRNSSESSRILTAWERERECSELDCYCLGAASRYGDTSARLILVFVDPLRLESYSESTCFQSGLYYM
jgi:hypothetical protein